MTKNNKKAYKKLRQTVASIILSAACITPVLATNEQKKKSSTSFWLRTGLELLLGTGCAAGVVREFQNRNTINSKDKAILKSNQTLKEKSAELTTEQQQELTALKTLIEKVYGNEYAKYLKITDKNVEYNVEAILKLPEANTLKLEKEKFQPTNENGIVQTYMTTKQLTLYKFDYANVHTIPPYNLCLLTLVDMEAYLMLQLCDNTKSKKLEQTNKALLNSNNTIRELQSTISTNIKTNPMLRKINFKSLALKLIELATEKSANDSYWKSFTDNGHTVYSISKNNVTFGESLLLLASKDLFTQNLDSKFKLETKNFKGQINDAVFLKDVPTIGNLGFKELKKGSTLINFLETKQLTLENILDIFTNQDIITQFDRYLVENTNFYDLATPIVKEYILLQLSITFLAEYCGYTSYKQKLITLTHDSAVMSITLKVNEVWGEFKKHIESLGLNEVTFSSVV